MDGVATGLRNFKLHLWRHSFVQWIEETSLTVVTITLQEGQILLGGQGSILW